MLLTAVPSRFYTIVLPDFADLGNACEVNVVEKDGSIGLSMKQLRGESWGRVQVFMTPEEGHELLRGLLEAIDRAERHCFLRRMN